ncbi:MAG: valine--tRNA ligase [Flavobacteriales bacterium]|nr:valine--tRNA ligase [Flavobacteriales bacterium]
MEISSKYSPLEIEQKWYSQWLENELFKSVPDEREPYTIVIPPPNVTGILHMGHMLNNTIQDVLVRKARMNGKNACWVPGTDHASIATEAKVVNLLSEKGISKKDLTREEFLNHAMDWKDKYGGIILEQLKKLGCSCDWSRTRFTMEPDLYSSVIKVFVDLYRKGYIYKGSRMVNWDPKGKTALSDEEVVYKEVNSKLYYVKYPVVGSEEFIMVATTRPETILGDTGVCVNPNDERYKHLKGREVMVPVVNRKVPVVFDEYVDIEFGTGALKVTPAHDINDYNIGVKYGLKAIDVFNEDGTMSEEAGFYIGMDRFAVRKQIALDLNEAGLLVKEEPIVNKVGYSERTDVVIEPRISVQWFMDMKKFMEQNPEVLSSVMKDEVRFYPSKLKNTYRHWIENIKDWCISRQLWWGHRIPAWYDDDNNLVVAHTHEEALKLYKELYKRETDQLKQDDDVLDTWFSSWLWPISVFNGINQPDSEEIKYYYPTNDLVTAPEIMFFWVARMLMSGFEFRGLKPFSNVYFTGIVRDKQRRKMSKQLGNSPDPIPMMEEYGADSVRMGMLLCSPAGNDILFDISQVEQGRNFCNKIWNAYRLVSGWETSTNGTEFYKNYGPVIHNWMNGRIHKALEEINDHFDKFRLSDSLMTLYKLIWDDFCSWYLEMVKPPYGEGIPKADLEQVKHIFEDLMKLLHPFMPFITEEIYKGLNSENGFINATSWPKANTGVKALDYSEAFDLITLVRSKRNENGISPKITAEIGILTKTPEIYLPYEGIIQKLANVDKIILGELGKGFKAISGIDEIEIYFDGWELKKVDMNEIQTEINYLTGFLKSVEAKLSNEKFVANAKPELVERERQKKSDTLSKIAVLEEQLKTAG